MLPKKLNIPGRITYVDMLITLLCCTTITLGLGEIFVVNCSKLFFPTTERTES